MDVWILIDERLMAAKNPKRSRHPRHYVIGGYSSMAEAKSAAISYMKRLGGAQKWKQGNLSGAITEKDMSGRKNPDYGEAIHTYGDREATLGHLRILKVKMNEKVRDYKTAEEFGAEGVKFELIPSVEIEGVGIVSEGSPYLKNNYNVKWDDYNIYDDDAAEVIFSIPANDPRMPLQEGELGLITAMVYGFNHPLADASWGELNERGMFWAAKTMEELANYDPYEAEEFGAESERVGLQYDQVIRGLDKLTLTVNELIKPKRKAVDDLANARDLINQSWHQMVNDGYDMDLFGAESEAQRALKLLRKKSSKKRTQLRNRARKWKTSKGKSLSMGAEEVAYSVMWEGKEDNNDGLIYGIEYMDGDEVSDVEWFATSEERDAELKSYIEEFGSDSFAAPYAGAGALMDITKDTSLGNFTSKELTESSAIHGDFDKASLNYSGHQNLEARAESFAVEEYMKGNLGIQTVILVDLSGSTTTAIGRVGEGGKSFSIADLFYEEVKALVRALPNRDVVILGYGSQRGDGWLPDGHGIYTKRLSLDRDDWTSMGGTRPISAELIEAIHKKLGGTNNMVHPTQIINITDGLPYDFLSSGRDYGAETFAVDVIHRKDGIEVGHYSRANEYQCGECERVYDNASDATICCKCPYCDNPIHEGDCIKYAETFNADSTPRFIPVEESFNAECEGCVECAWWRAYNDGEGEAIKPCPRIQREMHDKFDAETDSQNGFIADAKYGAGATFGFIGALFSGGLLMRLLGRGE